MSTTRKKYFCAVLVWIGLMTLLTPWRGVVYTPDLQTAEWQYRGTFDVDRSVYPIFLEPYIEFKGVVRWPGQPRNHQSIVELEWNWIAVEFWLGAVLIGFVFGCGCSTARKDGADIVLQVARAVAWMLLAVAPFFVVFNLCQMFSPAFKVEGFNWGLLLLGCAAGLVLGFVNFQRAELKHRSAQVEP
jgi:hypothetical protein